MAINNPYKAYQQNSVTQSTPGELTLMLYNGCLKFLNQAKKGIETKDIELKNTNIQKAQNILRELWLHWIYLFLFLKLCCLYMNT